MPREPSATPLARRRRWTADRALFRRPEVKMQAYARDGVNSLRSPPRGLDILRRSGFIRPARAAAVTRPPAPQNLVATDVTIPASGLPPLEPVPASAVGAGFASVGSDASAPTGPDGTPASSGSRRSRPKVDPLVQTAQMTRDGPPGPADDDASPPGPAQAGGNQPAPGGARGAMPPADGGRPTPGGAGRPSDVDLPPIEGPPGVEVPALPANPQDQPPTLEPLPRAEPGEPEAGDAEPGDRKRPGPAAVLPMNPILPGSQRVTFINPRSGRDLDIQQIGTTPEGYEIYIVRNGVNIITQAPGSSGSSTSRPIRPSSGAVPTPRRAAGPARTQRRVHRGRQQQPMEVYLEGNVIIRQDERKVAGKGDQRTLRATAGLLQLPDRSLRRPRRRDRHLRPGPDRPDASVKSPRIEQFHDLIKQPDGTFKPDPRAQDPRRPGHDDRQPVPQPRLPDQPANRST